MSVKKSKIKGSIHEMGVPSHNQLNKAVVLADVSLQDILARTKYTLKAGTVELHTLESALGFYSGCTRSL